MLICACKVIQHYGNVCHRERDVVSHWIMLPPSVRAEVTCQMIDRTFAVIICSEGRKRLNHIPRFLLPVLCRTVHHDKR